VDFIARAGSLVDRGHRIVGILLVIVVLQLYWILTIYEQKSFLQERIMVQNNTQSIYVVPNSQSGLYVPAEGSLLLSTFVDYVTQNYMTYTPANMESQYESIRLFFSDSVRRKADSLFEIEKHKAKVEEISSIFIVDKTSDKLGSFKELVEERTRFGKKTYEVELRGTRSFVVAGRVLSSKPVTYIVNVQETNPTEKNPFGFTVTKFFKKSK
jgi:type IV secretory pathway component VirB8